MSREDVVFTKRAIVVVAVLSVLGTIAFGGATVAWQLAGLREEITKTATSAATEAALAATEKAVAQVAARIETHERIDDARELRVESDVAEIRGYVFRPAWDGAGRRAAASARAADPDGR